LTTDRRKPWYERIPEAVLARLRANGAAYWRGLGERPTACVRVPGLFCDRHWEEVASTQDGDDPIYASTVTFGVAIWLNLNGFKPEDGPVPQACCKMPKGAWKGLLQRARTSYWAEKIHASQEAS
jgi:hypothetical protein